MNSDVAYARLRSGCDVKECLALIEQKQLLGVYPRVTLLNEEQTRKVWSTVAQCAFDVNTDVHIVDSNANGKGNGKKRRLENADSESPASKKAKTEDDGDNEYGPPPPTDVAKEKEDDDESAAAIESKKPVEPQ